MTLVIAAFVCGAVYVAGKIADTDLWPFGILTLLFGLAALVQEAKALPRE